MFSHEPAEPSASPASTPVLATVQLPPVLKKGVPKGKNHLDWPA
jgi:hypothetical protein